MLREFCGNALARPRIAKALGAHRHQRRPREDQLEGVGAARDPAHPDHRQPNRRRDGADLGDGDRPHRGTGEAAVAGRDSGSAAGQVEGARLQGVDQRYGIGPALLGADGAISGMGSVAADLQAELFARCAKGDLDGAREINDRLDPLVRVFYAPPFVDMHNRMKEALVLLGRIPAAHVRPPLTPVPSAEREAIRRALVAAGLLPRP